MNALRYLHVFGTLAENMVYRPRAGRESSWPGPRFEGDPAFSLVLRDGADRELLRTAPQVRPVGCGYASSPLSYEVWGVAALHPEASSYELRRGDIPLYARGIPGVPPTVARPSCRIESDKVALNWQAPRSKGEARVRRGERNTAYGLLREAPVDDVSYDVVAQMESGQRVVIAAGLTETRYQVDLGLLPVAGKGLLILVANDGVRSAEAEACSIDVPQRAPTVHILAPPADEPLPAGQPVSLLGCCLDMGGEPCPPDGLVWSLDGRRFAAGTPVAAIDDPEPGRHRLTLTYRGKGRMKAETSITLQVEEPDAGLLEWRRLIRDCFPDEMARG